VTIVAVGADINEPDLLARDRVVSVPAGGERMIGPLSGSKYRNATTGVASITYSGVTSLTLGVFDVPA
jgi:hypothetical protein